MMTVFRWECSARACGRVTAEQVPPTAAEVPADDVVWVDLSDPTPEEEQRVFGAFLKVHPLTLGDVTKPQREPDQGAHFPKVEEFADYLFVIVNPLPPGLAAAVAAQPAKGDAAGATPAIKATDILHRHRPQLSAVITKNVLITHHYQRLDAVDEVCSHLDRHADTARRGPDYLFHLLLDAMVDGYAPIVDRVSARLDRLEGRIFRNPSPAALAGLLRLKRLVGGLRKTLILEREVLARLTRGEFELVDAREIAYYRNVYDHLVRYTELIESAREMVSDLMQTHLSAASNRLNQVMKLLTMISIIGAVCTLIAGIYGMNFKHMPELDWQYGYPFALGLMATAVAAALGFFRWMRWI